MTWADFAFSMLSSSREELQELSVRSLGVLRVHRVRCGWDLSSLAVGQQLLEAIGQSQEQLRASLSGEEQRAYSDRLHVLLRQRWKACAQELSLERADVRPHVQLE